MAEELEFPEKTNNILQINSTLFTLGSVRVRFEPGHWEVLWLVSMGFRPLSYWGPLFSCKTSIVWQILLTNFSNTGFIKFPWTIKILFSLSLHRWALNTGNDFEGVDLLTGVVICIVTLGFRGLFSLLKMKTKLIRNQKPFKHTIVRTGKYLFTRPVLYGKWIR